MERPLARDVQYGRFCLQANELYQRIKSASLEAETRKRKLIPFLHVDTGTIHNLEESHFVVMADVQLKATLTFELKREDA